MRKKQKSAPNLITYLSVNLPSYLYPSIYPSIHPCIYLRTHLPITYPPIYLSILQGSARRPQFLNLTTSKMKQFCETSSIFELDNIKKRNNSARLPQCLNLTTSKNKTILRDFLNVWTWQHQKRSNSARLPQCLNLTTSKTKQFCETSSIFEIDNIKNEAILRDFLNFRNWQHPARRISSTLPLKMERWVQSWQPRTNAFCDFPTPPV